MQEQIRRELDLLLKKIEDKNEVNIADIFYSIEEYNKQIAKKIGSKRKERNLIEEKLNDNLLDLIDDYYLNVLNDIKEFNEYTFNQLKKLVDENSSDKKIINSKKYLIELQKTINNVSKKEELDVLIKKAYEEIPQFVDVSEYVKSIKILILDCENKLKKYNEEELVRIIDMAIPLISYEIKLKNYNDKLEKFINILSNLGMNCDFESYESYDIRNNLLLLTTEDKCEYQIVFDNSKDYYTVTKSQDNKVDFELIHLNKENTTYINDGDEYVVNDNKRIAVLLLNKLLSNQLPTEISNYLYTLHSNSIYKEDIIFMNEVLENIIISIKDNFQLDDLSIIKIINESPIYKMLQDPGSIFWRTNYDEIGNKIMENVSKTELSIYQNEKNNNDRVIKEVLYKISLIGKINIVDAYDLYESNMLDETKNVEENTNSTELYQKWFQKTIGNRIKK